jgi:CDP-glycerol glycerophosphotransferase
MYGFYGDKFKYIWSLRDKEMLPNNFINVKICGYFTIKYFYLMMTVKYIITNHAIEPFFPFRRNQKVIYTWHGGGAYKRVNNTEIFKDREWSRTIIRDLRSNIISFVISSCKIFTEIHSDIWIISKDIFLAIGLPRNDLFYIKDNEKTPKVYNYYNIDISKKIILYAPTFRGDHQKISENNYINKEDIDKITYSFKKKYGNEFIFFYRVHYIDRCLGNNILNVVTVSDYPDMQELLYAADILITDYSSSVWDFSLTYKPCFIYAPDLKKFKKEQGFYTPIEEWPFPLAETNEQLIENIMHFDEARYIQAVKKHHNDLGSYEKGTACKEFCKLVFL